LRTTRPKWRCVERDGRSTRCGNGWPGDTLDSGAKLTIHTDGSYSYDPSTISGIETRATGDAFHDSFTYTATDAHGNHADATVTITVNVPAETVTAVANGHGERDGGVISATC